MLVATVSVQWYLRVGEDTEARGLITQSHRWGEGPSSLCPCCACSHSVLSSGVLIDALTELQRSAR